MKAVAGSGRQAEVEKQAERKWVVGREEERSRQRQRGRMKHAVI
jgi:hypothetical protein